VTQFMPHPSPSRSVQHSADRIQRVSPATALSPVCRRRRHAGRSDATAAGRRICAARARRPQPSLVMCFGMGCASPLPLSLAPGSRRATDREAPPVAPAHARVGRETRSTLETVDHHHELEWWRPRCRALRLAREGANNSGGSGTVPTWRMARPAHKDDNRGAPRGQTEGRASVGASSTRDGVSCSSRWQDCDLRYRRALDS